MHLKLSALLFHESKISQQPNMAIRMSDFIKPKPEVFLGPIVKFNCLSACVSSAYRQTPIV